MLCVDHTKLRFICMLVYRTRKNIFFAIQALPVLSVSVADDRNGDQSVKDVLRLFKCWSHKTLRALYSFPCCIPFYCKLQTRLTGTFTLSSLAIECCQSCNIRDLHSLKGRIFIHWNFIFKSFVLFTMLKKYFNIYFS